MKVIKVRFCEYSVKYLQFYNFILLIFHIYAIDIILIDMLMAFKYNIYE